MAIVEYGPPGHRGVDTVMGLGDIDAVITRPNYQKAMKHVGIGGAVAAVTGLLLGHRGLTAGGAGAVAAVMVLNYLTSAHSRPQAYEMSEPTLIEPIPTVEGRGSANVDIDLDF